VRIVVAHSHLAGLGGGERCALELLRSLSRRHDVELWAGGYRPEATYPELAQYPRRDLRPWEWLTARSGAGVDAVVTQSFGASLLALRYPHTLCYVHTLRSVYLQGGARPDLIARRALDRLAMCRAAALLTNSAYTASRLERRYGRTTQVVPPGVDTALLALPERVGSYALYSGRIAPEKGVERLLAWSRELPLPLVLVGDGAPDYVARVRRLAGPQVELRGPLTGAALAEAYAGTRFLVFLPHEEEFGLAALEAMAAAKPVIAADEGGLPELVRAGETGLLVRDAQGFRAAAATLLVDDAACLQMGRAGRERARPYTWERFAAAIEQACIAATRGA
jgi:glycosyltransferase involved in cell wall biosynthesis